MKKRRKIEIFESDIESKTKSLGNKRGNVKVSIKYNYFQHYELYHVQVFFLYSLFHKYLNYIYLLDIMHNQCLGDDISHPWSPTGV